MAASQTDALARGLRLTCLTAAQWHGLWTPPVAGTHVYARRGSGVEPASGTIGHRPEPRVWPDHEAVAPLPLDLRHAVTCPGVPDAAILFESAWYRGQLDTTQIATLLLTLTPRQRRPLTWLRRTAESGTETRVRWWFESRGVAVRSQVQIVGVGRVDRLVGRRWIIECDSRAHHTGSETGVLP